MPPIKTDNFTKVPISSAADLRRWLTDHHQQEESVWIVTYKKSTPDKYVSTGEVLDELLCFGWIDGIRRKLDEERTMQLIARRRVQHWTKTYKNRAARLIEAGKMMPSGQASIDAGKASGLWHFMDDVDALVKPRDLEEALDRHPPARATFDAFAPSAQRFTLRWLKLTKTEATRKKRVEQIAVLAREGKKIPGI